MEKRGILTIAKWAYIAICNQLGNRCKHVRWDKNHYTDNKYSTVTELKEQQ